MADASTLNSWLVRASANPETGLRLLDRREDASWLSWSEVRERAQRVAGGLRAAGVKRGDRVAVVYPTGAGFFDAFFGVLLAGAVPVPLYPPVRLGRLDEYHHRTAAMLTRGGRASGARRPAGSRVLRSSLVGARPGCRISAGGHAVPEARQMRPSYRRPPRAGAVLVGNDAGSKAGGAEPSSPPGPGASVSTVLARDGRTVHSGVSWLPLYHDMGLIGCVFPALERPGALTLVPPELFVARTGGMAPRHFPLPGDDVPGAQFCLWPVRGEDPGRELDGVDLSSWRVALNGAEPVAPEGSPEFRERFARWGFRRTALTPVYGLSEAALAVTFSELERPFQAAVSTADPPGGRRHGPGAKKAWSWCPWGDRCEASRCECRSARQPAASPAGGPCQVQGPSLMAGYLDQAEATRRGHQERLARHRRPGLPGGWRALSCRSRERRDHPAGSKPLAPSSWRTQCNGLEGVRTGCTVAMSYLPEDGETERLVVLVEARKGCPHETTL